MRDLFAVLVLALGYVAASDASDPPSDPPPATREVRVWHPERREWVPLSEAPRGEYDARPAPAPAIVDGLRVVDHLRRERERPSVPCVVLPHAGVIGTGHVSAIVCGE